MKKHLITSAIPYVNGVKHLGNLVGSMLPADVYSRFRRQLGQLDGSATLFICGTDDHGTPVEIAAQKENTPVADFVKHWHDFQADIYTRFGLSFDHFGSSSSPQNRVLTQHFAQKLKDAGLIDVRTQTMLYSKADGRFLPDRYVEGECPKCHFGKARGDQCDNCGSVLDPTDLINPYSSISGSRDLELKDSKHLYLKQSQLVDKLRTWIDAQDWPNLSKSIAYKWLDEGLEDRGITRDIKWGVPVPPEVFGDDFADKVFYVWFDAPIAYIAATKEWADKQGLDDSAWRDDWWFGNPDVEYTEFMGKDNVYFHTLSFPATLIGSGEPWKKVDTLKSFNWLTYYGGKFSTSMGVGIFTDTALELLENIDNGPDYWRYYLIARTPESDDSAFMWPDFQAVVNKDLADVLGNFINRTLQFTHKNFGTSVPASSGTYTEADQACAKRLNDILVRYTTHMERAEMRKSQEALRELWVAGNEYLAEQEPWKVIKTDKDRAATILNLAIHMIVLYARAMAPICPFSAAKIMALFPELEAPTSMVPAAKGMPAHINTPWAWPRSLQDFHGTLPQLTTFTLPEGVLFPKIADEQIAEWEQRFGNQKI
ncbi:MAG: methionine--tRNA ligase [Blastochloris viridis]|uniref:Methionine--tRNA ligase n=1 Tax=Blastochloris viridis TaxID=1079 RepID=A0A6N4R9S8_BLAVI|nr:MAG: methionine--tRNA ligase [Blastochloris viridis]